MNNPNHPKKGSQIFVSPITNKRLIKCIKKNLENPRDLCLFVLGINTALRASDLLALTVDQVKYLAIGDVLRVYERKTKKLRNITINESSHRAIQDWLELYQDGMWLFPSQRGDKALTVGALNNMAKHWCAVAHVETGIPQGNINYGSHMLRKTFGYWQRMAGVPVPILMKILNHASQATTLTYLGIQEQEIEDVYMGFNL